MAQLDPHRERIQDDLRGLIAGEARCDDLFLQLYSTDASIYEIRPLGVVRPRTAADVAACVQYAGEKGIPVHARGAGSTPSGASLGPGLVVDFSKYMRRVRPAGDDKVRVQPGVAHERLSAHLRRRGTVFGPDPGASSVTTVGSVIAVDGAGRHWLRYGSARRHVVSLQAVLAGGQVVQLGREPLVEGASQDPDPLKRELVTRVAQLLRANAELIARSRGATAVERCGYRLHDVLGEDGIDMARLLAGSEGTLALVTEAVLATAPLPRHRGVALLLFDGLEKAAHAVLEILPHRPSACDLVDRRHLSLARETEVRFDLLVPREAEAAMLVELDGDSPQEVRDRLHRLVDHVWQQKRLAEGVRQAFDAAEIELFWRLARPIPPGLERLKGAARPAPVVDDLAVPPAVLPEFLVRMQNILKWHHVTASLLSHAGQGHLRIHPFLNLAQPEDVQKVQRLAEDLYEEVFDVGGTIGAEYPAGLSRTPFMRRQHGELYEVFRELKAIFDPRGTLNPGKIVGDDAELLTRNLRRQVAAEGSPPPAAESDGFPALRNLIELQLSWDPAQVHDVARSCNGCGECRAQAADVRMCPLFRVLPAEEASPRAKANLIRGVLAGQLELESLTTEEFREVADLCFNCHMCTLECPARLEIPRLVMESKGAYVAAHGLSFSEWVLVRLDAVAALAARVSPLANWALGNRQMRWLMERVLGIAQGRKLPRVAPRSFLRYAARRRLTRPVRRTGGKAAFFVDTYANCHDPELARALVAVLEHNGVAVYVPPEQKQAGSAAIAHGALDIARNLARTNVAALAEAVRQGYHVIATEPAAASTLIHEYPALLGDDDARLVAGNTSEACSYLWKMHTQGKLQLDLKPVNAALGYHMPCRLKALGVGAPGESLLRLVPGLSVVRIEEGCSGMAGAYGLARKSYRNSLRMGWGLINRLRDPNIHAGTTECSACKIQMEQGTHKPTIHPLKLFALSYGLMPELARLLTEQGKDLVVS